MFKYRNGAFDMSRKTYIMGILNMTPDSFSDGGKYNTTEKGLIHALNMVKDGADIIDIGGESTRANHTPISIDEELSRVIPVINMIKNNSDVVMSIDTMKSKVASECVNAGVHIINDVWGSAYDPMMAKTVAQTGAGFILGHNRNQTGNKEEVIAEIIRFFGDRASELVSMGVSRECICLDPCIGFAKTYEENIEVLKRFNDLEILEFSMLLATSNKSVISMTLGTQEKENLEGTIATCVLGAQMGANIVRVHNVLVVSKAMKMADVIIGRG